MTSMSKTVVLTERAVEVIGDLLRAAHEINENDLRKTADNGAMHYDQPSAAIRAEQRVIALALKRLDESIPYDHDMDGLQERVVSWAERTFPRSTALTCATHLREEVEELYDAVGRGGPGNVAKEAGDIVLILMHLCRHYGLSLYDITEAALAEDATHEYGPSEAGYWKKLPRTTAVAG